MRYKIRFIDNVVIFPTEANFSKEKNKAAAVDIISSLEEGYEIYSAIPLTTGDSAIIQYILRKELREI